MSNVLYQINKKLIFQTKISNFWSEKLLKFEICSSFSSSKQQRKTTFERNRKLHSLPHVSCKWEFHFSFWRYLFLAPPDAVFFIKNCRFKSLFQMSRKNMNLKVTFSKHLLEGSNLITSWFNWVLNQWFNLGSSVVVVKKLLSNSYFVTKVQFVALKSIFFLLLLYKNLLQSVFLKFKFVEIVLYMSVLWSAKKIPHIYSKINVFFLGKTILDQEEEQGQRYTWRTMSPLTNFS